MSSERKSPADGQKGDGRTDEKPNWEALARKRTAAEWEWFFESEFRPEVSTAISAVENAEEAESAYWDLNGRFCEFSWMLLDDLEEQHEIGSEKAELFRDALSLLSTLRVYLSDAGDDIPISRYGDSHERVREQLQYIEEQLDELEADGSTGEEDTGQGGGE